MDKEKEICDMAEVINASVYSQPIGERTLRTEIELAMALQNAGYGNVKQAVKEFAEKLKEELWKFDGSWQEYDGEELCETVDNLITELYGADDKGNERK